MALKDQRTDTIFELELRSAIKKNVRAFRKNAHVKWRESEKKVAAKNNASQVSHIV